MESIILLLLLVVVALVVSPIILLFSVANLRRRVSALEERMSEGRTPARSQRQESVQPQQQSATQQPRTTVRSLPPQGPSASEQFATWLKDDWLLKLGALLLLIGFGWLTTYAFMNNWIGPMGRIALGIGAGALILVLGFWRIQKFLHQGGIFLVLGSTVILLTIFAARSVYGFFTPTTALAMMFLSTAFVGLASVKYRSRALALGSLILASAAPLLTSSPQPNIVGLFAYLFIVTLGTLWIAILIQRRELTIAALIVIAIYSVPVLASRPTELPTLLLLAYAFAALFYITNTAGLLKLEKKEMLPDLLTAAGTGIFLIIWVLVAAQEELRSLILAAWMLVFVVGAFSLFTITRKREPLTVYAGVGIALLAAATSAELQGASLTIAYAIEGGLVAVVAYILLRDLKAALRTSLLLIGPILLSLNSITSYRWQTLGSIPQDDFFVLLILGGVLLGLGVFFWIQGRKMEDTPTEIPQLTGLLIVAGSLYFYILLWLSLHVLLLGDSATMVSLAVYTVIGLATHIAGKTNEHKKCAAYGGIMLGLVVARLLLVDVWSMELTGRIITFFLVGALLISTAFIGRKKRPS